MVIGDRVVITEPKHFLFNLEGSLIGFRGEKSPGDVWLLILVDTRNRSYLIPQSMVKLVSEEDYIKNMQEH
ncbi:MAG: hypothetical protein CVU90_04895 [Firmicutes bacterium HGW-Firmicutes-15]|nr:MAG: hypothetical protein CVU90_04895 [Firmicutes bacterium HGW-Firmicutes-15]